jgi:Arc/MetJ-type ribon-helix-helix transcriptional regulator
MGRSQQGRVRLSLRLDAESYAFVQRFMAAGVFESRDEMISAALQALARAIQTSARRAAVAHGCPGAEEASLAELADLLERSEQLRKN